VVAALNADDKDNEEVQERQEHAPKPKAHVHQTFEERLQIRLSLEQDDDNSIFSLDSLKLCRCPRLWRNSSTTNKKNSTIEASERGSKDSIPMTISFKCEPLTLSNKVKTMDGNQSPALILSPRLKIFSPSAA
jgi:hypothetical protein